GIHYVKQTTLETTGTRPDFTFFLPQNLKVNMDVKFPFNSYLQYSKSEIESDRVKHKTQFLQDVKRRINEVTKSREYINPEENTVDYVIIFIPNEQVYTFIINENDGNILDEVLKNKVILCSPITLYAVLSVIGQAVDNFRLEKKSKEIIRQLKIFEKNWDAFIKSLDDMGKKIDGAQKDFYDLRKRFQSQVGRSLKQIDGLEDQNDEAIQEFNFDKESGSEDDL
ncbi:MAG: DNA recombination protein RmuC, partial [Candidatus Poribacteria bacterium]